ncbi:hypothetical protein Tneu_0623 [Pyrobaculum neutrophilum V24Sta]|uniref:Uncharacterized protein n=1 Tax=Pyrobaculum neutrophilum (strain DSM 2338 / JCM 9278 / NBRC 100436 / V24Sta) TaxID=444157 RepID=B1YCP9_PYRNV|nr:hypothetical protein Tneu_0623 [Pyrobaculum neutrophilum V24Sta]
MEYVEAILRTLKIHAPDSEEVRRQVERILRELGLT